MIIQDKKAGNNSNINNEEIIATADERLEYKCTSTKNHSTLAEFNFSFCV